MGFYDLFSKRLFRPIDVIKLPIGAQLLVQTSTSECLPACFFLFAKDWLLSTCT